MIRSLFLVATVSLVSPQLARARQVEAGDICLTGAAGVGANLGGSRLAASSTYALVNVGARYAASSIVALAGDVIFGISDGTLPLRIRAGATFHIPGLEWPLQPYLKAQFSVGQLFGVLGADLTVLSGRGGVGIDYFLTAEIGAGAEASLDLGYTLGQTPSFYGVFELLVFASYTF